MKILVLESSTTSAKAMIHDTVQNEFEVITKQFITGYSDVTIHNAKDIFDQTMKLGRQLAGGKKIDMIALCGIWHSLLLCDKQMNPISPVYLWSYTGAKKICGEIRKDTDYVNKFYQKTGCMVNAIYPFFKLLMLKDQNVDLKNSYIMGQGTYNTYRLTGRRVITECMASGSGMFNIITREFSSELLKQIGITRDQLSEIVSYQQTFPLNEEGAGLLGLESGIPVIPANSDGGLNQIGAGALRNGIMTLSIGTSGAIRLTTKNAIVPKEPSIWCYRSPKAWLSGAATSGCCNCIDWFKDQMLADKFSYKDLEKGMEDNNSTLVFLPFIFGERCPGWNDGNLGIFAGISPNHKTQDFYRAIQEGVLFNLYQCYQTLTKIHGNPQSIKVSGGILHSPEWTQMCADIFGEQLEKETSEHVSLLGGVALAMELLGVIKEAEDYTTNLAKIIVPNKEMADLYQSKYARYLEYYKSFQNS